MTEQLVAVEITQKDIDNGVKMECLMCPVALALDKMYPDLVASVDDRCVRLFKMGHCRSVKRFKPCDDMLKFIVHFDSNLPVTPRTVYMTSITKKEK
jgi:hypothetical protein